jgi:hypothetical protein
MADGVRWAVVAPIGAFSPNLLRRKLESYATCPTCSSESMSRKQRLKDFLEEWQAARCLAFAPKAVVEALGLTSRCT